MSQAEQVLAEQLEQAGIPFGREVRFAPPRRWRADFAIGWDERRFGPVLLVEVEGGLYVAGRHSRGKGYESDLEKYNVAAELGYTVLRYSTRQVNDGTAIAQIKRILEERHVA